MRAPSFVHAPFPVCVQPIKIEITSDGSGGVYDLGPILDDVTQPSFIVLAPLAELLVGDPIEPDCLHVTMAAWLNASAWHKERLFSLLPDGDKERIEKQLKDEKDAIAGTLEAAEQLQQILTGSAAGGWARNANEKKLTLADLDTAVRALRELQAERDRREEPKCLALQNDGGYKGWQHDGTKKKPPGGGKKVPNKKKLHLRLHFVPSESCGSKPNPFTGEEEYPRVTGYEVVAARGSSAAAKEKLHELEGGWWKELSTPGHRGRPQIEFSFKGSCASATSGLRFKGTITGGTTGKQEFGTGKVDIPSKKTASFYMALQREQGQQARPDPDCTIVVFGGSGVGKSSLLNSILGVDKVLPVGYCEAGTAGITEINYENSKPSAPKFRFEVEFLNFDELKEEIKALLLELTEGSEELDGDGDDDDDDEEDDDDDDDDGDDATDGTGAPN
eukprot:308236-Prymnesium_polylepis.1